MTRGHGKVEQAIIEATEKEAGVLIPLWEIARDAGYDPNARATQHSWRRAATNLEAQGEISMYWLTPLPPPDREIVAVRNQVPCVGYAISPDVGGDWDDIDHAAALRCGELFNDRVPLYATQKAPTRPEAQFVLDMIEAGRWTVVDKLTGEPVDHHAAWLATQD
jgi:hypothetical protein